MKYRKIMNFETPNQSIINWQLYGFFSSAQLSMSNDKKKIEIIFSLQ